MDDCEDRGEKHLLYITGSTDYFLMGDLWFSCRKCKTVVKVDRFYFYLALQTPARRHRGY